MEVQHLHFCRVVSLVPGVGLRRFLSWERTGKTLRSAMRPFDIPIIILIVLAGGWFLIRRIRSIRRASPELSSDTSQVCSADWPDD